jgi:putative endonuclease
MFYVYILENESNERYIGYTSDLRKRLEEHNTGQNQSTKHHTWRCIYYEACLNQLDAKRREKYLKTTQGGRMLKRRLKEYYYQKNYDFD